MGIVSLNNHWIIVSIYQLNRVIAKDDIGTDDISFGERMRPTLTTIRFDAISLAERAVEMLVTWYKGQPLPEELSQPLMAQLVPHRST